MNDRGWRGWGEVSKWSGGEVKICSFRKWSLLRIACFKCRSTGPHVSELRSSAKVDVAVLIPNKPYGLCGRKAALN